MTDQDGKAPTPWELMRGIERIEQGLSNLSQGVMTAAVFAVEKQSLVELISANRGRIGELDVKIKKVNEELDTYKATVEDQRGKMRLMIYGLIGGPLVTLLISFIANGGLAAVR